jgi:hypothetical protein
MIFNVSLEVSYPAFGGLKLKRKIASDVQCVLAIFFSRVSRSMKQAQNGLPRSIQLIGAVRIRLSSRRRRKWNYGFPYLCDAVPHRYLTTHRLLHWKSTWNPFF